MWLYQDCLDMLEEVSLAYFVKLPTRLGSSQRYFVVATMGPAFWERYDNAWARLMKGASLKLVIHDTGEPVEQKWHARPAGSMVRSRSTTYCYTSDVERHRASFCLLLRINPSSLPWKSLSLRCQGVTVGTLHIFLLASVFEQTDIHGQGFDFLEDPITLTSL
ncbi:hypothetical protein Focb16_v012837 [Fusarium oxysporum f. sp. cubense]|uniref:Uncharacterized protein n=1 Tax=Fusarium oxysporum f. sp. cubense TaxID=61366 RepID=A0A559LEC4_FUSOC|nr:hypothetical protein Focb16_v012837 [Fusarium oxysporum f. sp. cubense]